MKLEKQNWFSERHKVYGDINSELIKRVETVSNILNEAFDNGGKLLVFGNGGSAAEAQHFSAELVCQFAKKRKALPAISLTTDTSIITAQGNDFGFETIFSRQIEALGIKGDVVVGFTTSDADIEDSHSKNVILAFREARRKGLITVGFFSKKTENLLSEVDFAIIAPHTNTAIIQELHLSIIHMMCFFIEEKL